MNPTVSIIVPCFNLAAFLPEALSSVQAQDYAELECIIVNDGSTDATAETASKFCAQDSRFRLIEQENAGVAAARNAGIAASTGEYLLMLDADDIIAPGYIAAAVRLLEEDPSLTLVYGRAERFGAKKTWKELPQVFSMSTMLSRNCLYVSCVFRRSDFDRCPGFDPAFSSGYEDWDFWLGLFESLPAEPSVAFLPQLCFRYRTRRGSRNSGVDDTALESIRRMLWDKHKALYSKYFPNPKESVEYKRLEAAFNKASKWSVAWKLRLLYRKIFR